MSRTKRTPEGYLIGNLDKQQMTWMERVLQQGSAPGLKNVVPGFELHDPQTLAIALTYINPRFYIADEVGLGKGLMAAGSYHFYRSEHIRKGLPYGKLLMVTKSSNLIQTVNWYKKYGLNIVPVYGDARKVKSALKNFDLRDPQIDGVIITWHGFQNDQFLRWYSENFEMLSFGIYDECGPLVKDTSQMAQNAANIASRLQRLIFTYGTPYHDNIMNFYYQWKVLNPTVMPYKNYLIDNFTEFEEDFFFKKKLIKTQFGMESVRHKQVFKKIKGHKNQDLLFKSLRYHCLRRTKKDFSDFLPEHSYHLVPVEMSKEQRKCRANFEKSQFITYLNAPTVIDEKYYFDTEHVPKLAEVVELAEQIKDQRPLIYAYNPEAQRHIHAELTKRGWRSAYINGDDTNNQQRSDIVDRFNDGQLDTIVLNVYDGLNIPTSDAIIFYTIPTMPYIDQQVRGRIDRNNYTKKKSYYYLMYMRSPEVQRLAELALVREKDANAFTGSTGTVFQSLYDQVCAIMEEESTFEEGEDYGGDPEFFEKFFATI